MEIKLNTTKDKKFRTILAIMSIIPPWNKLRSRELDVLAALYRLNNEYAHLPLEQREMMIFHKDNRKKVSAIIGISPDSFYNITMDLRKKGLLGKDKFGDKILTDTNEIVFKLVEKE